MFHFDYRFDDEELRRQFERFIRNNVQELFSDDRLMNRNYVISYVQARSVINNDGAYRSTLIQTSREIQSPSSSNSPYTPIHISKTLTTIHGRANGSFQKLMNELKKFNRLIVQEDHQFNVVWYRDYLPTATNF